MEAKNFRKVCSIEEHHAHPAVGSSLLRTLIDRSPAHYLTAREYPSPSTASQDFGNSIHQAILEPALFKEMCVVQPKFEGTGSRALRDQWHIKNEGKTIVTQCQLDTIHGILKSISAHKQASKLVSAGAPEESFFWEDPETKVQCKSRPDFLRDGHILVDVKSTRDASYKSFLADVVAYGYHIQAAMYLDGVSAVLDKKFDAFIIVACEKEAPFAVNTFQLDEETINEGRSIYTRALQTLKKCQDSGKFPAYPDDEIVSMSLPAWAFKSGE